MTKTYNIMNYEPQENGGDCEYTICKLFAMPDGSALPTLTRRGELRSTTVTFYTKRD